VLFFTTETQRHREKQKTFAADERGLTQIFGRFVGLRFATCWPFDFAQGRAEETFVYTYPALCSEGSAVKPLRRPHPIKPKSGLMGAPTRFGSRETTLTKTHPASRWPSEERKRLLSILTQCAGLTSGRAYGARILKDLKDYKKVPAFLNA